MNAGELRDFVTIEQDAGTTKDSFGQPVSDWQTYAQRYAQVTELSGRELFLSQQKFPEVDTDVLVRGDSETVAIVPKMRVRFTTRFGIEKILNVLAVIDLDGRGISVLLKCRKEG